MASITRFIMTKEELWKEIKYRNDISELERPREFIAARRIQAWFRGFVTRNHLRMLNKSATTVQRHWRGFSARKFAKFYLKNKVTEMWNKHYDKCATKIQALWRGYCARKNGIDLPKYRRWLQSVYDENTQALTRMKEFRKSQMAYTKSVLERESMLWILFILFKLHHLLSTKSQPGCLNGIDKKRFTAIETMMQSLEYTLYTEKRRRERCKTQSPKPPRLVLEGTYFARCEREIRDLERSMELGKVSIHRDGAYGEREEFLKGIEKLREELKLRNVPFRTITNNCKTRYSQDRTRVTVGPYNPPKLAAFTPVRPPRDKSKELHGDFKTIVKSNELYEAIDRMDCPFTRINLKCPVHDLTNA